MGDVTRWWAPHALPVSAPAARDVLVTVANGRITGLEAKVPRERAAQLEGVQLLDGCVIAPGFVNAHAHIEYASYDALVDGLGFAQWISDHVRRKSRLGSEHMRASAVFGATQALYSGITTIGDASFSGDAAHAMTQVGLRGRVYLEVFGGVDEAAADAALELTLDRMAKLPTSELVELGISPHAPYTVGEPLYRAIAVTGLPWMTHFFESADELQYIAGGGPLHDAFAKLGFAMPEWGGRSPVQVLADILGPHVVAAHGVHASPADLEVYADTGMALAHCPRSNTRLGCGVLDLARADRAGVLMGLGTDSPSSAGPLDPFAELRSALELHRAFAADPSWPDLARLHRLATADAAAALGYRDLGTLDIGAHADLIAVHVGPCADPLVAFVLGAGPSDVRAVLVAGQDMGVHDRNPLEQARARAEDARTLLALPAPIAGAR